MLTQFSPCPLWLSWLVAVLLLCVADRIPGCPADLHPLLVTIVTISPAPVYHSQLTRGELK